ncbi:MAG: site-2 protease family protein [Oscillospiraceae bacterium]|nr:site-2 protease family protein [Oscillospiraceae bacterium]
MYIILAILAFGILIASHELGHFIAAKACGVRVNEFAVGMGPAILKKQGKETKYSLRILPIGGFCAMEGEDEESEDPRAFSSQKPWKRIIILIAGAATNFLMGLIIVALIFVQYSAFAGNTIAGLAEGFPLEDQLHVGDTVYSIDGERIYYAEDFSTFMARSNGESVDMVIIRDGEKLKLDDLPLKLTEYNDNGQTVKRYGISFNVIEANLRDKLEYSWYTATNFVRLVRISLTDLFTGNVGVKDLSGVVGIVNTINDVGEASKTTSDALINIAYLCAFIAVNLAVMNMLPIPALDGGRVFLLIVTVIIEKITGKHIDPKYEGYIHAIGMLLLLALMAFVMYNDIVRLIHG